MNKEKKPDLVVWDEEKGYNSKSLTYGTSVSAPAIKMDDVASWKEASVVKVNHQFKTRYDELVEEARKLADEYNWNEIVYTASYSFQPVIGQMYHLYMKKDESLFLSLISPSEWKQKFIASFKLDSTEKWVKL
jgi:hypothetical protein